MKSWKSERAWGMRWLERGSEWLEHAMRDVDLRSCLKHCELTEYILSWIIFLFSWLKEHSLNPWVCMEKIYLPGSSPGGSRVIRRWGWSQRLWKNTYLITDIEREGEVRKVRWNITKNVTMIFLYGYRKISRICCSVKGRDSVYTLALLLYGSLSVFLQALTRCLQQWESAFGIFEAYQCIPWWLSW